MGHVIALILIGFGTVLGCLILWKIFDIVRSSVKGNKITITEEDFDRLARAFIRHKKEMQERVQNLEAVIADEKQENDYSQIEAPENEGTLTNDLQEKIGSGHEF